MAQMSDLRLLAIHDGLAPLRRLRRRLEIVFFKDLAVSPVADGLHSLRKLRRQLENDLFLRAEQNRQSPTALCRPFCCFVGRKMARLAVLGDFASRRRPLTANSRRISAVF